MRRRKKRKQGEDSALIGSTTTASIRYAWGGWWSIAQRGRSKRGTGGGTRGGRVRKTSLRFVWRASFYGTQWQQHPVPCHLRLAGH